MRKVSALIYLLVIQLGAQNIPIDSWRSHYSYTNGRILEVAKETLFCATENGLFSIDTSTGDSKRFGKENGLGDAKVTALHFAESSEILLIGYESGIVDLVRSDGSISTILTIRDAGIVADKAIQSITSNEGRAYLATGFGVVYLNLPNEAVVESYRSIGLGGTELSVLEVLAKNDSLYIISDQGIQAGSFADNLLDFNDWLSFDETETLTMSQLVEHEDRLYVIEDGINLWSFDGSIWSDTGLSFEEPIQSLESGEQLLALGTSKVWSVQALISEEYGEGNFANGNDFIEINGNLWIADGELGLLNAENEFEQAIPAGPQGDYPLRMKWVNGKVYAFYGPSAPTYDGTSDGAGYSLFKNGVWEQLSIEGFSNLTDVAAIGEDIYFSSMGDGLYVQSNDVVLDETNSDLEVSEGFGTVDLSSLQSQADALWISSYNTESSIKKHQLGEFTNFDESVTGSKYPVDLEVSTGGVLWIRKANFEGGGLAVFDPITIEQRSFGVSSGLPSSQTTGITIDETDRVWISSVQGLGTYDGASFPFNSFDISVPIFQNGLLFENEQINDVITDGGDRVWVGTEKGVWVLTDDLSTIVAQYTTDNSPIPSNEVRSFTYDEVSGEVFISTSKGIVSYRSASASGYARHDSFVKVFPNPVSMGFNGQVGISGLAKNAILKITDVKGRLVKELEANGSSASWDLSTFNRARAQTGIYLIFSSSEDGQETLVGKVAVLK